MRRARAPLFPVNVWPPIADGLTLALAVIVVLALAAAVAHAGLAGRLHAREAELSREKDARARLETRLRALAFLAPEGRGRAAGSGLAPAGSVTFEDGKVILQGEVLFRSGSDELSEAGLFTVQKLAVPLDALLQGEPDQMVLFGGHTDDVPIANQRFSSNWELSTARATAVAKAFVDAGLPPSRIIASGFGSHHPRGDNRTPEGRRANRRIEILLVPIHAVASR
jgi:flagellar motor protein MotB